MKELEKTYLRLVSELKAMKALELKLKQQIYQIKKKLEVKSGKRIMY
jgi:hypothetical protein